MDKEDKYLEEDVDWLIKHFKNELIDIFQVIKNKNTGEIDKNVKNRKRRR